MINYLDEVTSTHKVLIEALKNKSLKPPIAISADIQSAGVGSRDNLWEGFKGNLFLSFCQNLEDLPYDLPQQSISIYYSYILKSVLTDLGSNLFLKWPNDFYIDDKKIGGTITKIVNGEIVVCSIGLNLKKSPDSFQIIDINIDKKELLKLFFLKLKQDIFWKDIFRNYQVEFSKSRNFLYYDKVEKKKVSLESAILSDDGSILVNGRKVFSLR